MNEHLAKEIEFYKTIINDCKVIVDVGSRNDNVFYELNNNIEAHLFDPNNVRIDDKIEGLKNIRFNNYALGNYTGETVFHWRYDSIILRTEEPKFIDMHDEVMVKIDTLKNYCEANNIKHIDILKIDTEGYDFEVIKGCGEELIKNVRYIQFEEWLEGYAGGETVRDVFEYFRGWNIYKINTRPVNYVVTKETIDSLTKVQ